MCKPRPPLRMPHCAPSRTLRELPPSLTRQADAGIQRATQPKPAPVQHMRVDHRRPHITVPQELLHRPDVVLDLPRFSGHPAYPDLIQGGGAYGPEACPAAV